MARYAEEPEIDFDKGKLRIRKGDDLSLITPWPPKAIIKGRYETEWVVLIPKFRLVKPYRATPKTKKEDKAQMELAISDPRKPRKLRPKSRKKRAFEQFRFALPKPVASALEPYLSHQWNPLLLLYRVPETLDLFKSNPALAYYLANTRRFSHALRRGELKRVRRVVTSKQQDILDWIDFRGDKQMAKIMRKIRPESATPESYVRLKRAARSDDALKLLSHTRELNAGILDLVLNENLLPLVTRDLLDEVLSDRSERYHSATARVLRDVCFMQRELKITGARPFKSRAAIQEEHDALMQDFTQGPRKGQLICRKFPPPPLPGTPDFVPLTSAGALREEGQKQHNCVASYAERTWKGKCYVYRILAPERATLSIERNQADEWVLDQLFASCNTPVKPATLTAVKDWLGQYSRSV